MDLCLNWACRLGIKTCNRWIGKRRDVEIIELQVADLRIPHMMSSWDGAHR
jgi:hypothetical protein